MDIFDEFFGDYATDVTATASTKKDAKGVSVKIKFDTAPGGEFADDSEWLAIAEDGGFKVTQTQKREDGRSRSKSGRPQDTEDGRQKGIEVVAEVLGVELEDKPKKRRGRNRITEAEVPPEAMANGKAEE